MKVARRTFKVEVPSMAMGDIAFNLLIFFVILAKAHDDSHIKWVAAKDPKVEAMKKAQVGIVVDVNNKVYLNGREISEQQLTDAVRKDLGDAVAGERLVLLKIHHESQALRYEKVLESVSEAGGDIVHVLEKK